MTNSLQQMPLRIPSSLHVLLKEAARAEGMSLNQYCLYLLARHVPESQTWMTRKAEDLLTFLTEAQTFQKELKKGKTASPSSEPLETPPQRLKELYG